jgi:NAD+ synthase
MISHRNSGSSVKTHFPAPRRVPLDLTPTVDVPAVRRQLVTFLKSYAEKAGADGYVIGLSGGVDSAVAAALAVEAVGADRVTGYLLPHQESNPVDAAHGRLIAEHLRMPAENVDVTPIVDAVAHACAPTDLAGAPLNNVKARARMIILYAHANAGNRLVLGTGNKSELLIGYFTKHGDGGADVYPLGDLYKTTVWALARDLNLPAEVTEKPPSAGLYEGQTDEAELGASYADLDRVLRGFEENMAPDAVARATGLPVELVRDVERRVIASEHKRSPLAIPKVGFRTPGLDWRSPRHRAPTPGGESQ